MASTISATNTVGMGTMSSFPAGWVGRMDEGYRGTETEEEQAMKDREILARVPCANSL